MNDDSELRAWSAAPELFARDDVLIGIVRDVRYGITEHLRGNYREHALQASLHPNAEQIEDVLENLERNMRGLSALGHSAAREPLLTELLALLHDNDEKVVERAAVAASLLRWSQVALCALEPRLIQLMSAGGSERPIIYLAAYAAAVLGSVQTPVLDFIHDSHWARRLRRRVGAKQRESLESRVLCRLESSYSTSELVNTLRGLNRVPSYVVRRHVRCIHQLLGDPRPDVATAAANALVALATCRRGLEVQPALQRSVLAAERRIKIVLDGRLLDLHAHLLRAIVISPPNSLPSLDSATLARLVTDTTTSVRDAAIELATITLKKNDESLLRALELELSGRSTHAWDAVAELWHEWKVSDRTAAVIDEKLALVLSRHDLVAWRYELLRKMGLVESADDECLWYALCRRLEKGEYIHGGTAAWQTPRSEVPAYVQRSIAQAMLHDDSQDLRDTAVTAAKALARRARITDLWTELITKSISGEYFAREGLIKLRTTVSVLTREIGYLTVALQREIPGEESWRCVVETCDALQTHSVSAELVIRAINQLGSSRTADKLQWGILTLICQVRDTELAQVSDCAIRMLESGGCDEVILLRFVLIPLAKRGDHRAINCLLGRCKNCDVLEQIVREVADVLQRLPEDQVQELLRNPNGFKDNHYAIEQLQHLASKLADRTGLQDWEFWRDLAHDSSPPQLRAVALERLAGAPGCWPLNEDEIYMIIASEEESQQPVREAVLRSLPEIYPLGLPSPVLERLVKHYRFNEDIHNVTKKLGPSALRRLIAELVKFAQSGTESGVSIDVDQRCKILELLKGAPFKSQPLALTDVWNCLYDPERAVRQATVKLVTDIGRDWLSVQCPVPSRFTPTNRPETYLLPEGLSEHLRCALTTKNSFNEPKQAALCVLRVLGPLADQPKIVDILASMVGNDTHRRSARSARRRLESLGYLIEESEGDHVPKRTACAAEGAGW